MANRYIRHRTFTLNEGYEIIQNGDEDTPITINGFLCSTTSVRLRSFVRNGTQCAHPGCPMFGSFFAMEKDVKQSKIIRFHLNLYAIDPTTGAEVLMTHDHVHARSQGGQDHEGNTQTMCITHNHEKSLEEQKLMNALKRRELTPMEQLERRFSRIYRRQMMSRYLTK